MEKIYIVLTYTGTVLSRIIKNYTKDEFSHVSISLDSELKQMYSFGRLKPYNPFVGGFVHEGIYHGTFKRFKNTVAEVYSLEVTQQQYEKICKMIDFIKKSEQPYKFNIIGLLAVGFKKRVHIRHSFYCAEFIKYVLEHAKINTKILPEMVKPEDFKKLDNLKLEYKGKLREYKIEKENLTNKIMFCKKKQLTV